MILALLILLFILKFNSPAAYLDYLIGLVLMLCAASAILALRVRTTLHAEVDVSGRPAREGEDYPITVRIVSPELFGRLRMGIELSNLQRDERRFEKRELTGGRTELSFSGLSTGTIELSIAYAEVFGIFGVLRLKKKDLFRERFNVYPAEGLSPDRHMRVSYLPEGGEVLNAKGSDMTEIYEVRPLQEGDDLRHVHRQLSAKYDEYIIKVGSDSRRPVYEYQIEEGLSFPEASDRIAQLFTLRRTLDMEEGALMAASYRGRSYEIFHEPQLYALADAVYEDYLPAGERYGEASR